MTLLMKQLNSYLLNAPAQDVTFLSRVIRELTHLYHQVDPLNRKVVVAASLVDELGAAIDNLAQVRADLGIVEDGT